jgi:uncharacterized membrane-anchored protein
MTDGIRLPPEYPDRRALADEVHARPYAELQTPERASYLAVAVDPDQREAERAHLADLCRRAGVEPPEAAAVQFGADCGAYRIKWERHGEFSSYIAFVRGRSPRPYSEPALLSLPEGWVASIPGRTLVAAHAKLVPAEASPPDAALLAGHFGAGIAVGGEIADGAGEAYTDFRVDEGGFTRFLVLDRGLTRRQAGRMLQRLFEIEAYRVLALLALPEARRVLAAAAVIESELRELTETMASGGKEDEALLGQLTDLAARVESTIAATQFRFGASLAYYRLVRSRIAELRERRVQGTQTIGEFMERRLGPAMATCETAARRVQELSERVARASGLLSTRVSIARERQNQALLASMDRRARVQLRLQQTVEGLSVAAITYYMVGLVAYAAKALESAGYAVEPHLVAGLSIPVVALLLVVGVGFVRRRIVAASG